MRRWVFKPVMMWAVLLVAAFATGCNSAASPQGYENGGAAALPSDYQGEVLGADGSSAARCIVRPGYDTMAGQLLSLMNIERAKVGVAPLTISDELTLAAEDYACVMATEDFFDHTHPATGDGPGDRAAEAGYEFFAVGENLAAGQPTAAKALEGWMESPDHRSNLLSPEWKETGIGIRGGGTYGIYWVQEFGKPAHVGHQVAVVDGALTIVRD